MSRPRVDKAGQDQLDEVSKSIESVQASLSESNPFDTAPPVEIVPQTELSKKEKQEFDAPVIKPKNVVFRAKGEKFKVFWDKKYAKQREKDREYVKIIAENRECPHATIEMWTAKYGCDPAEFWEVPVNQPVWVPRMVANQICKTKYHVMVQNDGYSRGSDQNGQYQGGIVVRNTRNRLIAYPAVDDSYKGEFAV